MFTVYLFAADPEKLRDKLANDEALLSEIRARIIRERSPTPEATDEMCAHVAAARRLDWPRPGKMLSVNAFLWMLDYAAEPINVARLRDIRYDSLVDEIPLLDEMVADPGPLPVPDVRRLPCSIGFLSPQRLRELAERGRPPCENAQLDVGTELVEIFESLADDNLGLYTVVDGARRKRREAKR